VATEYTTALNTKYAAMTADDRASSIQSDFMTKLLVIAKKSINLACDQASPKVPSPFSGSALTDQDDGNGPYIFLCRDNNQNIGSILGAYEGDRLFWFRHPGGADGDKWATSTAAHEMGHLRSLRHSHTSIRAITYVNGAANTATNLVGPYVNGNPLDHDPVDAYRCLMGYLRPLDATHCAMCQLSLRLYDRVAISKDGNYRDEIMKTEGPVNLAVLTVDASNNVTLTQITAAVPLSLAGHQTVDIMAVGPEVPYTNRGGNNVKGRVNMTDVPRGEANMWSRSGQAGAVSITEVGKEGIFARYRVKATAKGTVTLTFRNGKNPTASCTINVT
jgi:hypothetical protein